MYAHGPWMPEISPISASTMSNFEPLAQARWARPDVPLCLEQLDRCQNGCLAHKCQCATLDLINSASSQETLVELDGINQIERKMGDTELSYYLPARENGVNDMYLHLGCHAPPHILELERIRLVWAILRTRHPLLASKVKMSDYDDVYFVYVPPYSAENALDNAGNNLEYRTQTKDELIDSYLNGPRTLSNDRISYLIVSLPRDDKSNGTAVKCEFLICAAHFLGDGIALHQFANDFFGLLGSSMMSELAAILSVEWQARCGKLEDQAHLPSSLEDRLPSAKGNFGRVASRIDFQRNQEKFIGGHTFPRMSVSIDESRTKGLLKRCKARGVSISSALFAICNIAWAKTSGEKPELPTLMYSALNLRPYLMGNKAMSDSYWFVAIGYFNVVLPGFLPRSGELASTFWHRARSAKIQSTNAVKNPMIVSRSREMARERGIRAQAWAKEDDQKERGIWKAPPPAPKKSGPPSSALIGLSLLGNLDGIYKHAAFPDIKLETLTTGSRQREGGMLLFGYTFVGKLWLSLGYDENGFNKEVVERFWGNVLSCTDEFLIT
ncbi:hypothetical protein D9615_001268 [Tricholomella constricta]|uniref:Alcohol acetyltransferase n=1 Tax=Tricholomella constricta TaxID=117010 RepID=A0A8H5HK25_9AGAR|nr:hypothetical protein D9615_001268 [Tricholomella constricta]